MSTDSHLPTIAVLFGGRSSEHAVSCVTAASVLSVIDESKYRVLPIGITKEGHWQVAPNARDFSFAGETLPEVIPDGSRVIPPLSADSASFLCLRADGTVEDLGVVDVVFPVLHGPYGEDGTVQGLLELSDTKYVGAGVLASAASMDKHYMKVVLASAGIPMAPFVLITDQDWRTAREAKLDEAQALGDVLFVKPARGGSSIGISQVSDRAALIAAVEDARQYDHKVIIEPKVSGREIECGVLGSLDGAGPEVSVLGEIVVGEGREFYDFDAKYLDEAGSVELVCPAQVSDDVVAKVHDAAIRTFEAFGCEGMARVDTFVTADGEVLVNELNTLPGFTPVSMFPRMWQHSGVPYATLIDRLIALALGRAAGMR